MPATTVSRSWLVAGLLSSSAVILGAPYLGQLRTILRTAVGGDDNFAQLMVGVVGGAAGLALLVALARIRTRRLQRYGAIAAAFVVAAAYALASRTGNPAVDAVERFHFVEYGVLTFLYYRAWRPAQDGSLWVMPMLMGLATGTLEEWLQWFVPVRVGEVRDVVLNFVAIGCGLLFSLGLDPPAQFTRRLAPASRRQAARLAAAVVVLFGLFFHAVHLGYEIKDPEAGIFRSRYSDRELGRLVLARSAQWAEAPPVTWSRFSQEDQYFSEAIAHVRRRNEAWQAGQVLTARHENLILEKYYGPVLDTPSYVSATGLRWPAEQRAAAHATGGPGFMIYVSDGEDYPIFAWPKWLFWLVLAPVVVLLLRQARSHA